MTLDRAFQIASRLLALVGLLSLILTHELSPPFGLAGIVSVAVSFILVMGGATVSLSRRSWTALNLVVLAFFILDLILISQSLLVASTRFVVFLMINKLFNLKTPQDHLQLYLISFLQLLAASTFTADITFVVSFVLYLLTATWALLLHHLVTEDARPFAAPGLQRLPGRPPGLTWLFFLNTNGIAIGALGCTLLLFVLLPRVGLGFFHRTQSDLIRMSGFSEQVDLGEIGTVKLDSTVVMRVQPSRPLPPREGIYWRGMVFDSYDGRAWRNRLGRGGLVPSEGNGVFHLSSPRYPDRIVTQEVILEPLDTAVLFGAPYAVQVSGRFPSLKVNEMGSLSLWTVPATRIDYTLTSQLPALTFGDAEARSVSYPPSIRRFYLQLPDRSDRIRQLSERVTESADTVLRKVTAIENYLQANYRYTLNIEPASSDSPIEDFLFGQKAGYCEHYATAMTLLLRSIGIPARLVTGFLPGEWNEFGKYYTVRQSDAHAWVEVWFPQTGWYPFDPTPPAPSKTIPALWGLLARSIDSLQWRWNRYVIYYSLRDQISLAKKVTDDTTRLRLWVMAQMTAILQSAQRALASAASHPAAVAVMVVIAGTALFWIQGRVKRFGWRLLMARGGRWKWPGRRLGKETVAFYFEMLRLLRAIGYAKPDTLTPQEFLRQIPGDSDLPTGPPAASSVMGTSPLKATAAELTRLYYRVRFAGIPLSNAERQRVTELLFNLKTRR